MKRKRALWWVLLVLYAATIFALSSFPLKEREPVVPIPHEDKLVHFLEFFFFFVLSWKALPNRNRMFYALLITGIYAGSDELHQLFVPMREASIVDWLAGFTGGVAGMIVVWLCARFPLPGIAGIRILGRSDHKEED